MKNLILGTMFTLVPFSLSPDPVFVRLFPSSALNTLLTVCVNGGTASIWFDYDRVVYIECKQIKPPHRYPR